MDQLGKIDSRAMSAALAPTGEDWLDRTALAASTVCLIHCLVLPLALAALPLLGSAVEGPWFHPVLLALIVPTSGFALFLGWHRRRVAIALAIGIVGLGCLAAGVIVSEGGLETIVTVCGSLLLAAAHVVNWRSRRSGRQGGRAV